MKEQLSPRTTTTVLIAFGLLLLGAAAFYFRDSFASQPTVEAKPWAPPGAWSGAKGAPGAQVPATAPGGGVK